VEPHIVPSCVSSGGRARRTPVPLTFPSSVTTQHSSTPGPTHRYATPACTWPIGESQLTFVPTLDETLPSMTAPPSE
jgi:hypothetical protein